MNDEIASKLEILEEYTVILRGYQQHDVEDLIHDHTLRGALSEPDSTACLC